MTDDAIPMGPGGDQDRQDALPAHERDDARPAGESAEEHQFPPPAIDLGEPHDDDEEVPDGVPPGPGMTRA